ncbi:regulator of volume decrease after cellular swelling-domain-containing protein [Lipomyces orientalis]|uniref:Regulator of volume decrease after cellular swelling-domain-containing protein n=1 Tax=Lipomyces orientalis TaxID=1233043 RepID=A0ACC3TRH9_9ASCO
MPITILESPPTADLFEFQSSSTGDAIERHDLNAQPSAESLGQSPTSTRALHYHSSGRVITVRPTGAEIPGIGNILSDGSHLAEVFVAASNLILYVPSRTKGISIPYKHLTVHAIQRDPALGIYMQLEDIPFTVPPSIQAEHMHDNSSRNDEIDDGNSDECADDADLEGVLELVITALPSSDPAEQEADITKLFDALSSCSALNPDQDESEDDDDEMGDDEAVRVLGSREDIFAHGHEWITAENVDQFVDVEVEAEDRVRFVDSRSEADETRFMDAENEQEPREENGDEDRIKFRRVE